MKARIVISRRHEHKLTEYSPRVEKSQNKVSNNRSCPGSRHDVNLNIFHIQSRKDFTLKLTILNSLDWI